MGEWWQGWPWLNENAWVASALMVIALAGGAATMGWHVWRTRGRRSNYLAIVGLLVLAAAFVLTGVSVGERPIVEGRVLIPTIRLLWLAAAVIFNGYLVAYWWRRITLTQPLPGGEGQDPHLASPRGRGMFPGKRRDLRS